MNHRYTPYIAIIAAIAQVAMWTTATFRGPAEVGIPLLIVSTAGLAWLCGSQAVQSPERPRQPPW